MKVKYHHEHKSIPKKELTTMLIQYHLYDELIIYHSLIFQSVQTRRAINFRPFDNKCAHKRKS